MGQIIVERHAKYHGGFPALGWGKATEEEQKILGHLTAEGIEQTKVSTSLRLSELNITDATQFLVVASPTFWLDDPRLGQRAVETARVIERLISVSYETETRINSYLCEAQIFDTPYPDFLREKKGNFWEDYLLDKYQEERIRFGAEDPIDIALRMGIFLQNVALMMLRNVDLVAYVITHGECMDAFLRHIRKVEPQEIKYNGGFMIETENNQITMFE